MRVGEVFNPRRCFHGSYVPNWLMQRREVQHGAKLCYGRIAQFAGHDGRAFPSQETLAEELGVSNRQVARYIEELTALRLIRGRRKTLGGSNHYVFLWHEWMDGVELREDAPIRP